MTNSARLSKDELERKVFLEFAEDCPIDIDVATIESRQTPEPDIFCKLRSGQNAAFELTTCDDDDGRHSLSRGTRLHHEFRGFLKAWAKRDQFLQHMQGRDIIPHFAEATTFNTMKSAIPAICEFLLASDLQRETLNTFHPVPCENLQSILQAIDIGIPSGNEPNLHFFPPSWLTPSDELVVAAIQRKLGKQYRTSIPIELVAWFGITPAIVRDDSIQSLRSQVPTLLRDSPFHRLWVYLSSERRILFVHPHIA